MNEPTELELQLWLASQLPEEICPRNEHGGREFVESDAMKFAWWDTGCIVTSREWPYVVSRVEEKLTELQRNQFVEHLIDLQRIGNEEVDGYTAAFLLIHATWQTKSEALMKVIQP